MAHSSFCSYCMCGSAVLQDAEASFQVICSRSSAPDCLESVPLSPSHPQQKHVKTATDAGCQTNTLVRGLPRHIIQLMTTKAEQNSASKWWWLFAWAYVFVIPVISPVCYNGIPCHLSTFVKKGQTHLRHSHRNYHIYNCTKYELRCVKLLCVCECASRAYFIQVLNKSTCPEAATLWL